MDSVYREGNNSFLYRLDPRLKLILLLGIISCLFSATNGFRLILIAGLWLVLAADFPGAWKALWQVLRKLRWLLLGTLLLHLLFSSGHTLLGTSWLYYEGLLRGMTVVGQLVLALLFSLLLSWTTRPEALAWAAMSLLAPLRRLRVPVAEIGGLLLLVLHFVPLIQEETQQVRTHARLQGRFPFLLKAWAGRLEFFLNRLFVRADELAEEIYAGRLELVLAAPENVFHSIRHTGGAILVSSLLLLLLWQV